MKNGSVTSSTRKISQMECINVGKFSSSNCATDSDNTSSSQEIVDNYVNALPPQLSMAITEDLKKHLETILYKYNVTDSALNLVMNQFKTMVPKTFSIVITGIANNLKHIDPLLESLENQKGYKIGEIFSMLINSGEASGAILAAFGDSAKDMLALSELVDSSYYISQIFTKVGGKLPDIVENYVKTGKLFEVIQSFLKKHFTKINVAQFFHSFSMDKLKHSDVFLSLYDHLYDLLQTFLKTIYKGLLNKNIMDLFINDLMTQYIGLFSVENTDYFDKVLFLYSNKDKIKLEIKLCKLFLIIPEYNAKKRRPTEAEFEEYQLDVKRIKSSGDSMQIQTNSAQEILPKLVLSDNGYDSDNTDDTVYLIS